MSTDASSAAPVRVRPDGTPARDEVVRRVHDLVRLVPDYPEPGVLFRDITPLLADAGAFAQVVATIADEVVARWGEVDLVAGMEARGFLLAAPVATALGAGVVPVRKAGKLPGPTASAAYSLEYADAEIEIHPFTIRPGARVLVVDDVLATGGTAAATVGLLRSCGAQVVGLAFLVEILGLAGRERLAGLEIDSVVTVD